VRARLPGRVEHLVVELAALAAELVALPRGLVRREEVEDLAWR